MVNINQQYDVFELCLILITSAETVFLSQTNFFNWQCKVFAQFYDGSELKKGLSYKKL